MQNVIEELRKTAGENIETDERKRFFDKTLLPLFREEAGKGNLRVEVSTKHPAIGKDVSERHESMAMVFDMVDYCMHVVGLKCRVSKTNKTATFEWGIKMEKS